MKNPYTNQSSPWTVRIADAVKLRTAWENKYKCKQLEEYYQGFQWKARRDIPMANYNPYTINLVYSAIKIKLATILFQRPRFNVSPAPGNSHWDIDFAIRSAQLKQDTLNTITGNPNVNFVKHLKLAALESFFRFAIIEVGYAADWRNPQKEDPQLKSWEDPSITESKDRVVNNNEVPVNERFYIKKISAKRFLVPQSEATDLADHDWCGYHQYYYTNTLKNTPGIDFPENYESGSYSTDHITTGYIGESEDRKNIYLRDGNVCKCYHIFDSVAHKRRLLLDDGHYTEIWSQDMERLPIKDLRWDLNLEGFYPIPPVWQWLSPQDEINESREQARSHRRRFTAKYAVLKGKVDQEEQEKFFSGPDGVGFEVKAPDAIKAVDPPAVSAANQSELILSKEDFNIISGTSAEARPGGDRETATKSQITNQRAQLRESADQLDFSEFVCLIGREILSQANEKLVEGLWVKYTSNPSEGPLTDMQVNQPVFKYIKAQDLSDGYDFTIDMDVNNATPAAMQAQQQAFTAFLTLITQFPMLAMSPILIREAAYRVGYKNEQVIHQMQQVALLSMAAKASQEANKQGMTLSEASAGAGGGATPDQTKQAQMQTPDLNAIGDQLSSQVQ